MVSMLVNVAGATSVMRLCRQACTDEIDTCIAEGGTRFACRKLVLGECKRTAVEFCGGAPAGEIPAPSALTAKVVGSGTIVLQWIDNARRERSWVIERSLEPTSGFAWIGATAKNVVTYSDVGLASGLTLYYRVIALGHGDRAVSAYSNVASATTRDMTPPSIPTGLAAAAASCSQVNLTWTTAVDVGGSGLRGYNLYRDGTFVKLVTGLSTSDAGRAASTPYSYTISAIDNAGNESARSAAASATTPACADTTAPTVPAGLTAAASGCSGASLAWTGSTDSGGSSLKGYNVYRNNAFLKQVTATSTTDGGLAASTAYGYAVSAIDNAGNESARSAVVSVTIPACADTTAPTMPSALRATASSCNATSLAWTGSTDSGGSSLKGYNVYRNNAFLKQVTATSTTDGGLAGSTAYGYAVSAIDNAGNESARSAASVSTPACPDTTAPTVPASVTATASSCNLTSLSWGASTDSGGSGLKGYNVYRNNAFLKQVTATSTTDGGLSASTVYGYAVSAVDNAGNESARSATSSTNTPACPDVTPPAVPAGVGASASSCSQVGITWGASTDTGGSGLKGYNVYRNNSFLKQVTSTSTTDAGLVASTTYTYAVSAIDNAGNESARSAAVSSATPACPSAATGAEMIGCVAAIGAAKDVVVENGRAYVASAEFGLAIADVSNPAAPVAIGVTSPPFYAERVAVSGTLAVLTGNGLGLNVVDVSDPRQPRVLSSMAGTMKGVAMAGQYAYVIVVVPGNPARTDLMVVDLRTPANPVIAGRVTVATATELRVVGSIVFLAARVAGVQLVDVSHPAAPTILGTIDTPDNAKGVAISGSYAFVADNSAVVSIDLGAVPPAVVGSLAMTASALAVEGTRLYVLDGLQMKIVDVANPAAPVLRSTSNAFAAQGVDAAGSLVFLASPDLDPTVGRGGLYVIDASTPTAPRVLTNIAGGYDNWGVGVVGNIGVVAGNGLGLKVVDLSSPTQPRVLGSLAGTVKGATMAGQYAYIILIVPGNPARIDFAVVDLRTPSTPTIVGRVTLPGGSNLKVDGSFAYVTAGAAGLQIIDISTPTAPRIVGVLDTPGTAMSVDVAGNTAYVADDTAVLVVNVADRTRPAVVSTVVTPATALTVGGARVYAIGGLKLKVIDVATPSAPVIRSTTTAYGAQAVQVIGTSAFLATPGLNHFDTSGGVYLLDVANPAAPRLVKQIIVPGTTRSLAAVDGRIYAGDSAGIIDVITLLP